MVDTLPGEQGLPSSARERILDNAYELFSHRGIRAVGIDEVITRAGVAKATLDRHFPSKDDLVLAFLEQREQLWTRQLVEAGALQRGSSAEERLLAIFDVFDDWFQRDDYEGCSFIKVLLETADRDQSCGGWQRRSGSAIPTNSRSPGTFLRVEKAREAACRGRRAPAGGTAVDGHRWTTGSSSRAGGGGRAREREAAEEALRRADAVDPDVTDAADAPPVDR